MNRDEQKEFEAAQALSVIVSMLAEKQLQLDVNVLMGMRDPRFGDLVRLAIELLRKHGHEAEVKLIEEMPLRPLRYMKANLMRSTPEDIQRNYTPVKFQ